MDAGGGHDGSKGAYEAATVMGDRVAAGGGSDDGQRADDTGKGDDDAGIGGRGAAGAMCAGGVHGGSNDGERLTKKQKKALRDKNKKRQWEKMAASRRDAKARRRQTRNESGA